MNDRKLSISKQLLCATLLLACSRLIAAQINLQSANTKIKVIKDNYGICSVSKNIREQLHNEVKEVVKNNIVQQLFPVDSCADIPQDKPSGFYWFNVSHEPQQVYCSVNENRCCNQTDGKWMRIAYLNMSDPSTHCPEGWREVESPIRTCRRQMNTSITSVYYSSYGIPYSKVCGRIIAYQFGTPEAFTGFNYYNKTTIDDTHVDGISITYGQHPRNHVWTFVGATSAKQFFCSCTNNSKIATPPFIMEDYFCERGTNNNSVHFSFIDNNPLWDGDGCTGSSTCCEFNNPPWFCKQLPESTTEDIEIRTMTHALDSFRLENEDTPVQLIEIYVQ